LGIASKNGTIYQYWQGTGKEDRPHEKLSSQMHFYYLDGIPFIDF
jgi:hypothetical protein